MRRLRSEGFETVVHTFSEHDLRYSRGTMAQIVGASREIGLRVWLDPWGVGGVFGGEAFSDAALREPGWAQRSATGARLPACCPTNPGFRAFVDEWIEVSVATGADAIFWDEPHFFAGADAASIGCACRHCDDASVSGRESRQGRALLDFLVWACGRVASRGGRNILCLVPPDGSREGRFLWESVARVPALRGFGTTPFWAMRGEAAEPCVTRFARDVVAASAAAGVSSHVWIQAFQIPAGREQEITAAMRAAIAAGVDTVAVWGFDGCAAMSSLACEQPEVAWEAVLEGMSAARDH